MPAGGGRHWLVVDGGAQEPGAAPAAPRRGWRGLSRHKRLRPCPAIALALVLGRWLPPFYPGAHARAADTASSLVVDSQTADASFPDTVDFELKAHGFEASRAELNYKLTGEPVTAELHATVNKPASSLDLTA